MSTMPRRRRAKVRRTLYVYLRHQLKTRLPSDQQARLATLERQVRRIVMHGDAVACPCCHQTFRSFLPAGEKRRRNARCPGCGALERHRLLWLFLQQHTRLFTDPLRMLHIAPERVFRTHFASLPNLTYITADLFQQAVTTRADLQALPFNAAAFDVILCSHVLEHVSDDYAALRELRRALSPAGVAILHVPIHPRLTTTYEDPTLTTPSERLRAFGQADHVRKYGRDYPIRLGAAGFTVTPIQLAAELPPPLVTRYGIDPDEIIYACYRG